MPPLPVIAQVVRASCIGTTSRGTPWVNVMHFRCTAGAPTPSNLNTLAAELALLYDNGTHFTQHGILDLCKTTTTLDQVKLLPLDGASASTVYTSPKVGLNTDDELPAETSLVVTLRTGLRGPRHRGRVYLPPMTKANVAADGRLVAAYATALIGLFQNFQTELETMSWEQVVASYKHADWNLVTAYTIDLDFDVQRRRKA